MKFTLSYEPWREQPFFAPRNADLATPLPEFAHLRMTIPGRSRTVHDSLIALIDSASKRVFVCSFLLGGEAVRDALRRAVQRIRGHVYVITALDDRALQRSLAQELDEIDEDALKRERKSFEALTRRGVYVRGAENCHAKFCIVDDRAALVGSANFDPNGLDLDERGAIPCGELGLVLESPERVAPLAALFRHLWKCGCQREAPPLREGYRLNGVPLLKEPVPAVPVEADAVVWTGFNSTAILDGIQRVIVAAQHTLLLASYSFTGMREKPALLLNALADARKRGVQVEMLLRDRSRDLPEIAALLDIGVEVRANRENHAKYAIADGDHGLLFSANFDGVHGLTDGVETGVWLRRDEALEVAKWHALMWRETPSQALRWPTAEAFAQAVPTIRHERPAFLGERLSITGHEDALSRCAAILKGPCLLVSDGSEAAPRRVSSDGPRRRRAPRTVRHGCGSLRHQPRGCHVLHAAKAACHEPAAHFTIVVAARSGSFPVLTSDTLTFMSQPIGLIQLVSEEAMPSLFPILALKPTALVHVTSQGFEQYSEPVLAAAALAHLCPPCESVQHLRLPAMPSIAETHNAVKEGIEWLRTRGLLPVINFTGGTKLMSIGSFSAAIDSTTPSLYVDGNRQVFVDGQTGPELATVFNNGLELGSLAPLISVRMILTAYGCAVENTKRHFKELAPVAAALLHNRDDEIQAFENMAGRNGAFAALRSAKNFARWREADLIRFDLPNSIGAAAEAAGLVRRVGRQFRLRADLHHVRKELAESKHYRGPDPGQVLQRRFKFFEGGWWEVAVAHAVGACSAFADVNVSLTISKGGRLSMEEDVLAMQGLQLAYFSCKRSSADKLVRHLEEVDASARRLGGKMARKYLAVCHLPESMRDGLQKRARQLRVTLIEPPAVCDGVSLLEAMSL